MTSIEQDTIDFVNDYIKTQEELLAASKAEQRRLAIKKTSGAFVNHLDVRAVDNNVITYQKNIETGINLLNLIAKSVQNQET